MNEVLGVCRATWRRLGLTAAARAEMEEELHADLAAAAEAGIDPLHYVGGDADAFAASWACERGLVRPRPRLLSSGLAGLVGATPGAGFGLFVAYGVSNPALQGILGVDLGDYPLAIVALYALGGLFACIGAIAVVGGWLSWLTDPAARPTVRRLATAVPLGSLAGVALAITVASLRNFSTSGKVVAAEVVVTAFALATAVVAARYVTIREYSAREPG